MARQTMPTNKSHNLTTFFNLHKRLEVTLIKNLYPQLGLVNGTIGDVFKNFVANCNKTLQAHTIHKPTHVNKFQQFHIRLPITTKHNI
jgi:hypothetical protein